MGRADIEQGPSSYTDATSALWRVPFLKWDPRLLNRGRGEWRRRIINNHVRKMGRDIEQGPRENGGATVSISHVRITGYEDYAQGSVGNGGSTSQSFTCAKWDV